MTDPFANMRFARIETRGVMPNGKIVTSWRSYPLGVGKGEYDPARLGYFRDARTGFCFAVSSYSRVDSGGKVSEGLSHTAVPCTPQVEALLRSR